jgi:two-component system, NarL family, sensor histidine kinase DevS
MPEQAAAGDRLPETGYDEANGYDQASQMEHATRLELDDLLEQLILRARDVQVTQGRLRGLLQANLAVARAVDLEIVLRHMLDAARTLVQARYAALGVVERGRLVRFLHVGMDPDNVADIGYLPEGKGLLGRLIDYPQALRLPQISEHMSSVGFPAHHPPMRSFLGVPIRLAERVFGNLYLTDKQGGAEFSQDDEELLLALAAAAGVAIENAALFSESRRRQEWQAAMVSLSARVLTSDDPQLALPLIVQHAHQTCAAAGTSICVPADEPGRLRVAVAVGVYRSWQGAELPIEGSVYAEALAAGGPVFVEDPSGNPRTARYSGGPAVPLGPLVAVPMVNGGTANGVLYLCRQADTVPFSTLDLEMLGAYAGHAALLLQLVHARQDNELLRMIDDRRYIATELHQRVIQRLFRLGLDLQGLVGRVANDQIRDALRTKVEETDAVIRELREAIFSLQPADPRPADPRPADLHSGDLADDIAG